jgi:hypothetical protein
MAYEADRKLMLDWARLADEAGFDVMGTIDKPTTVRRQRDAEHRGRGPRVPRGRRRRAASTRRRHTMYAHHVLRYTAGFGIEPKNLIHIGPAHKIAEVPSLDQVEQIAEHLLPAYR